MLLKILKFGGTSLDSVQSMRQIVQILRNQRDHNIVVVSALAGMTNQLINFCRTTEMHQRQKIYESLLHRYRKLVQALGGEESMLMQLQHMVDLRLPRYIQTPCLSLQDKIDVVSLGEDLSAHMMVSFLASQGVRAETLEARSIVITEGLATMGKPHFEKIQHFVSSLRLDAGKVQVMQGFIGSSLEGRTTLLGRGGSDFSAAILGSELGAQEVVIYTDVSGVFTADPHVIANAKHIPHLCFDTMLRLAQRGAKVLHAPMVEHCYQSQLPIRVTSLAYPHLASYIDDSRGDIPTPYGFGISILRGHLCYEVRVENMEPNEMQKLCSYLCDYAHVFLTTMISEESYWLFIDSNNYLFEAECCRVLTYLNSISVATRHVQMALVSFVNMGDEQAWSDLQHIVRSEHAILSLDCQDGILSCVMHEDVVGLLCTRVHREFEARSNLLGV